MMNNKNISENDFSSVDSIKDQFQNLINYLSLYFSSQLKHADLSAREIGFNLLSHFTFRILLTFVFLIGFAFISYASVKILSEFLFFSESISYFLVGVLLVFIPLFFLFFKNLSKKWSLSKKIKKFKSENLKLFSESSGSFIKFKNKKIKNEKEFIVWKESFYKEHLINSFTHLKRSTSDFFDIAYWVKQYPWETTGTGLFLGFSLAMQAHTKQEESLKHTEASNSSYQEKDFFSELVEGGSQVLKEVLPTLILSHFTSADKTKSLNNDLKGS